MVTIITHTAGSWAALMTPAKRDLLVGYCTVQAGLTNKSPCFSATRARDRVLLTRCRRSQIFTKYILHVTVHLARPVRLTYTMYQHAYRKPSADTHMHS